MSVTGIRQLLSRVKSNGALSFGLANAPSQFVRIMELVMSGLTYDVCLVYLDDILIFSKTFDEHLDRLATVFDRLAVKMQLVSTQGFLPWTCCEWRWHRVRS